jgi:drug/metabolite transporter (DMT)-like permease
MASVLVVALGLAVAASYGAADFLGGLASKRTATATVTLIAQAVGLALLAAVTLVFQGDITARDLGLGAIAGVVGAGGLSLLYKGLAEGRMSVVAPITAVGAAVVPVAWGIATGERPSAAAIAGVVVALAAVTLISRAPDTEEDSDERPTMVPLAVAAGTAFGIVFIVLGEASQETGAWPLVAARAAGVTVLLVAAKGLKQRPHRADVPTIIGAGILDVTANALYLIAARRGLISLVAVLSSLYPAGTVLLARLVLDERLARHQVVGLPLAAAGVALIALG